MFSLNLFTTLSQSDFLEHYWQQRAFCFKQAYQAEEAIISGDELAYLACDKQIESRFVYTDEAEHAWEMEAGPFNEDKFDDLPQRPLTLMVQSVDHWVPEIHALNQAFDFIPRWRLDDVLATYANEGGGVGPHFDYYDVFLIQISGQRRWRLGQTCTEDTPLQENTQLKLLKHFAQTEEHILSPGDILYVPPGLAHWGTAVSDDCITLSIGFRAPSQAEIIDEMIDPLLESCSDDLRYTDSAASLKGPISEINSAAIDQAVALVKALPEATLRQHIANALGNFVSRPRHLEIIEAEDDVDNAAILANAIASGQALNIELDAVCRAAFIANGDSATLFLNGQSYALDTAFAQGFCEGTIAAESLQNEEHAAMLLAMAQTGLIYLEDSYTQ